MLKCILILLTAFIMAGCIGTAIAILEGDTSTLEEELEDMFPTSGIAIGRGNPDDFEEFYSGLERPDFIDVSKTAQTAFIITTNERENGDCYLSEPATTRRVVVDAGATHISAICNYFRNDRFRTAFSRFEFNAETAMTYRLAMVFHQGAVSAKVENEERKKSGECMALIDTITETQLECNELHDMRDFYMYGNTGTSERPAELLGNLPLCGVTPPYHANARWRKGGKPPIRDRIVVDPGRLRFYAACLKHGFSKNEYYRAAFEFDVTAGATYQLKRLDKETDLAVATPEGCIRPIKVEEAVPIVLCTSDALPVSND